VLLGHIIEHGFSERRCKVLREFRQRFIESKALYMFLRHEQDIRATSAKAFTPYSASRSDFLGLSVNI
jgi:hypothetical protein